MEYERIEKPPPHQSGGHSPGKLRSMLLMGVEKKRRQQQQQQQQQQEDDVMEEESVFSLRSQHESGGSNSDVCKDVDVVSEHLELKDHSLVNSRVVNPSLDYDDGGRHAMSVLSLSSPSPFEFQKADRAPQRVPLAPPFSKPAPSKWDDAQKWIASPTSSRAKTGGVGSRKMSRQPSTKVVVEVPDQKAVAFEEPNMKKMDISCQAKREGGVPKFVSWEAEPCPVSDSYGNPVLMIQNSVGESAISLSQHNSSMAVQSTSRFIPPPSTARSVSMRDMGTEMTPIASQEPSRTGTPVRATTPIRSPTSSRPATPSRAALASPPTNSPNDHLDRNRELSEKELQRKTMREIMVLGTQLGKMNIASWASKDEEDTDASTSLKTVATEPPTKNVIETRAAVWEEAEKAKYVARFKREEMKIQAWENHQKAKTEAEMRKIEVEVERIRGRAQDKLMNKLATARHKAEEKRAAAEAKRSRQAAKTEEQAEYIRTTGRIPSSFSFCGWCC